MGDSAAASRRRVAILMGGASSEREVSLVSGRAVMEAIDTNRYEAVAVELGPVGRFVCVSAASALSCSAGAVTLAPDGDDLGCGAHRLADDLVSKGGPPDIVFIALHGRYGEDGTVQGMLELLGIPYTGSGVLASALAMDKIATKRILESSGVTTPRWMQVTRQKFESGEIPDVGAACGFPAIVKPNREGSTIGVTIVNTSLDVPSALEEALRHDDVALVEEFIKGMEITVGVLGTHDLELLPIVEICPKTGFYDYQAKYTAGMTEKIIPARLDSGAAHEARRMAELTHRAVGCSGMSRVDMLVTPNEVTVLEVNTIPGLTPTSLLPRAAQAAGISFTDLISRIIESGLEEGVR